MNRYRSPSDVLSQAHNHIEQARALLQTVQPLTSLSPDDRAEQMTWVQCDLTERLLWAEDALDDAFNPDVDGNYTAVISRLRGFQMLGDLVFTFTTPDGLPDLSKYNDNEH